MFHWLTNFLFKYERERLVIYPDDMKTILGYRDRVGRGQDEFVESSAGPARTHQLFRTYRGQKESFYFETPCHPIQLAQKTTAH